MSTAYLTLGRMVDTTKLTDKTYRRAFELGLQSLLSSTALCDVEARREVEAAIITKPLRRRRTRHAL